MVADLTDARSREQRAAQLLSRLVEGTYRHAWLPYCKRQRQSINQSAVATVLSQHLWETGQASELDVTLPRRLKDRVSRALSGRALPPAMLQLFIEAFAVSPADARLLWEALLDDPAGPVIVPGAAPLGGEAAPRTRDFETVSVHDYHRVGADRCPVEHRTVHVIRAHASLSTFQYRFDTDAAVVQVLRGGRAAELVPSGVPGLHAVDITFTEPLEAGQTASLEYRTIFAYQEPPEPLFRRVSLKRSGNVAIHVAFDRHPRSLQWCHWNTDHLESEPVSAEPVRLNSDGEAHRFVEAIEAEGVGFAWEW